MTTTNTALNGSAVTQHTNPTMHATSRSDKHSNRIAQTTARIEHQAQFTPRKAPNNTTFTRQPRQLSLPQTREEGLTTIRDIQQALKNCAGALMLCNLASHCWLRRAHSFNGLHPSVYLEAGVIRAQSEKLQDHLLSPPPLSLHIHKLVTSSTERAHCPVHVAGLLLVVGGTSIVLVISPNELAFFLCHEIACLSCHNSSARFPWCPPLSV